MHKAALESCKDRGTIANGKTPGHGSFGVDDRPDRLSGIPDEVLAAIDEEERGNPPATWKEAWERSIDWEIENGVRLP